MSVDKTDNARMKVIEEIVNVTTVKNSRSERSRVVWQSTLYANVLDHGETVHNISATKIVFCARSCLFKVTCAVIHVCDGCKTSNGTNQIFIESEYLQSY